MPEEMFKVSPHTALGGKTMVEYWRDGKFIAGIYPHQDGIRVVSKYMTGASVEKEPSMQRGLWTPAAVIMLEV